MQAITKNYGFEESIKLAINAGIDILCFSNNITGSENRTVDKVHEIIRMYVERGEISRERINESYTRIKKLKQRLNYTTGDALAKELATANQEIMHLQQKVNQSKTTDTVKVDSSNIEKSVEQPLTKKEKRRLRKNKS